jgi:hypothetical protein
MHHLIESRCSAKSTPWSQRKLGDLAPLDPPARLASALGPESERHDDPVRGCRSGRIATGPVACLCAASGNVRLDASVIMHKPERPTAFAVLPAHALRFLSRAGVDRPSQRHTIRQEITAMCV